MKTAELTGAMLDYWVARAEEHELLRHNPVLAPGGVYAEWFDKNDNTDRSILWRPSDDWSQGGPIIEREKMHGGPAGTLDGVTTWFYQCYRKGANGEHIPYPCGGSGQTPLIAAMRAYVASKFGEEVPDAI
ncbi:MAG TPA: phage protein NinX family protein [Dongiaceae bacterium]|nr:phage protein NinX family protein [Dongiaceae bacterium]